MGPAQRGASVLRRLLALALIATACGGSSVETSVPPSSVVATVTQPSTTTVAVPEQLADFAQAEITVGDETWVVALARSGDERQQGLMGVTDLGELDGMLFVMPFETRTGFWMKDTLIPLEVAFFTSAGNLVNVVSMEPCRSDPCPVYRPDDAYRWALEAVPGRLSLLHEATVIDVGDI